MALGDDVVNAILNPQTADIERLRRRLNKIDGDSLVLGDMITDKGGLNVPSITAQTGEFNLQPFGSLALRCTEPSTLMIPNDTATAITFTDKLFGKQSPFVWDSSDPTKIYMDSAVTRGVVVAGYLQWASNATGWRDVRVAVYNAVDGGVLGTTPFRNLALNGDDTMFSFFTPILLSGLNARYVKINVYQNSGGDLQLEVARVLFFLVH